MLSHFLLMAMVRMSTDQGGEDNFKRPLVFFPARPPPPA